VQLPEDYPFPPHVANRPRDFKLMWFFTDENAHLAEDWLRFAICKEDEVLEQAKERLRGLKKYIKE
jgi:kynurenine aminotransferase